MWDYDLATVDCRKPYSTCHCLQRFRQFELSVCTVCMRASAVGGEVDCGAEGCPHRKLEEVGPVEPTTVEPLEKPAAVCIKEQQQ